MQCVSRGSLFLAAQPRAAGQAQHRHARVQHHAGIAGLGAFDRFAVLNGSALLMGHGGLLGDLLCSSRVAVILAADSAVPVLDVARHEAGGPFGGDMRQLMAESVALGGLADLAGLGRGAGSGGPVVAGGGDVRTVRQLDAAALAVGVAGVALLGAGGGLGVLHLGAAVVVLRVKLAPLVDVSIRSLVVAGGAVLVVHSLRAAGGLGLQVHIARTEDMIALVSFPFIALGAAKPVAFGVPFYGGIRAPFPSLREAMSAVVLLAADGACAHSDTGRGAVAAAVCRVDRITAITPAGAGVGLVVALGLPCAPVVAQDTVFIAAFLAGFARGAGGRFGAAGVIG